MKNIFTTVRKLKLQALPVSIEVKFLDTDLPNLNITK